MKSILSLIAGTAAALLAATASAQSPAADFPSKPVTIVTPFAAGSGPDAVLRLISDKLGRLWNQRVLVDNKPGGGGFIAIEQVRRAAPDGYTLLQLDSEHIAALPHLYKSRNFVTLEHFDPVASLFRTPFFVAVPTDSKWKNMTDLIAAAKEKPGQVSYGSWGVGSPGHLGGQQLEALTGTQMQHVPYREVSQLFANVGSGEVQWSFASIPSSQGIYKAGKLRYIAIAAPKRIPQMPDVPTMAEAGGPGEPGGQLLRVAADAQGRVARHQGPDQRRRCQGHRRSRDPRALRHLRVRAAGVVPGGDPAQRRGQVQGLWGAGAAGQHQPRMSF